MRRNPEMAIGAGGSREEATAPDSQDRPIGHPRLGPERREKSIVRQGARQGKLEAVADSAVSNPETALFKDLGAGSKREITVAAEVRAAQARPPEAGAAAEVLPVEAEEAVAAEEEVAADAMVTRAPVGGTHLSG
jgi:hypothetical protein